MHLNFTAEGRTWPIRLSGQATRTRAALLASLPLRLQLHTPKIAGSHIYWHAPFVEDVEGATHVLDAQAGAFIYWPVRQFLEITFAPLQAENAQITVLGQLDAAEVHVAGQRGMQRGRELGGVGLERVPVLLHPDREDEHVASKPHCLGSGCGLLDVVAGP